MAIDLGLTRPLRRPSDRVRLVEAVLEAHPADESEWLEWKSDLDLGRQVGRFEIARHVLGFANRPLDRAARFLAGQAFLVVGVEPGNLRGTSPWDPADLENWLRPYVGEDGPLWEPHPVEYGGKEILVVEVSPPQPGDPIHALKRAFNEWREGTIFVRHLGKTEPATSADMAALSERFAMGATGARLAINISWAGDGSIRALDLDEAPIQARIESERHRLLAPLERGSTDPTKKPVDPASDLLRIAEKIQILGGAPEDRDPEEYRRKVEDHLERLRQRIPSVALSRAIRRKDSRLVVRVENPSETNFHEVELSLYAEGEVFASKIEAEAENDSVLPAPPRLWGTRRPRLNLLGSSLYPPAIPPRFNLPPLGDFPDIDIDNNSSSRITFPSFHLRPRAVEYLDPFVLLARMNLVGQVLDVKWDATSTSADGIASGWLTVTVADEPLTVDGLLHESEPDDDDEDSP